MMEPCADRTLLLALFDYVFQLEIAVTMLKVSKGRRESWKETFKKALNADPELPDQAQERMEEKVKGTAHHHCQDNRCL